MATLGKCARQLIQRRREPALRQSGPNGSRCPLPALLPAELPANLGSPLGPPILPSLPTPRFLAALLAPCPALLNSPLQVRRVFCLSMRGCARFCAAPPQRPGGPLPAARRRRFNDILGRTAPAVPFKFCECLRCTGRRQTRGGDHATEPTSSRLRDHSYRPGGAPWAY